VRGESINSRDRRRQGYVGQERTQGTQKKDQKTQVKVPKTAVHLRFVFSPVLPLRPWPTQLKGEMGRSLLWSFA
jgi:hypothetical protein